MQLLTKILNKHPWMAYVFLVLLATVDAVTSIMLIYSNDFAPVGIQGFAVMIQEICNFSVGYTFFLVNAPMLLIAFFVLSKSYSYKNLCYILSFSAMTLVFQSLSELFDWHWLEFVATTSEQKLLAAAGYGVIFGVVYPLAIWLGGATGGTDILAALVHHYKPAFNMVWVLFSINTCVAVMSYFVYGRVLFPVILSILCAFLGSVISDYMFRGVGTALKFEIVTDRPEELSREIMDYLNHGCTMLPSRGMYSGKESALLICVVNKKQRVDMERIIAKYKGSFGYCSAVKSTYGEFDRF